MVGVWNEVAVAKSDVLEELTQTLSKTSKSGPVFEPRTFQVQIKITKISAGLAALFVLQSFFFYQNVGAILVEHARDTSAAHSDSKTCR
jgi:hypothetical protein